MKINGVSIESLNLELRVPITLAYGRYPILEYTLLRIETDTGLIGLGEAAPDPAVTGETQQELNYQLQQTALSLINQDPFNVASIVQECQHALSDFPAAVAAVDMALFDLMGQAAGLPVHHLLGGKTRTAVPLYPIILLAEPEKMAAVAAQATKTGAKRLKIKLGTTPDADLARLEAITNVIGPEVELLLDVNQGWRNAKTAIPAIHALRPFNVAWVEQPVAAADLDGMAAVTAAADLPIMADESCHTPTDLLEIIQKKAADMVNIKLMKCGGLWQASKMVAIAAAAGMPAILGSMGESSIGSAAGLHLMAARPWLSACELVGPLFITNDPAAGYDIDRHTLHAYPSTKPGLGVTLL